MANPLKGESVLKVEGEVYTLAFDINALCEVEQVLDLPIDQILAKIANPKKPPPLFVVRALLWGGLRRHHAHVDLLTAGAILEQLGGQGDAVSALGAALEAAFPAPAGDDKPRPRMGAPAGIGRRSSNRG